MSQLLTTIALLVSAGGLVIAVAIAVRADIRAAVPVLLDFLLAAGLLRLTADADWNGILVTALIVVVRHVLTAGLSETASVRPSRAQERS